MQLIDCMNNGLNIYKFRVTYPVKSRQAVALAGVKWLDFWKRPASRFIFLNNPRLDCHCTSPGLLGGSCRQSGESLGDSNANPLDNMRLTT
jgi:hypothetical protein